MKYYLCVFEHMAALQRVVIANILALFAHFWLSISCQPCLHVFFENNKLIELHKWENRSGSHKIGYSNN
jgi:hypothetical protein